MCTLNQIYPRNCLYVSAARPPPRRPLLKQTCLLRSVRELRVFGAMEICGWVRRTAAPRLEIGSLLVCANLDLVVPRSVAGSAISKPVGSSF
ncbi:hypothetical protein EVAR_98727_1 [Eumeta japonica]|uniref:Uncharacterized protein n=1 Tax=Eumeta variegata TaxID=151549 RepID=A0A4C1ZM86_EUMVA|nr:hypothetical protein EVAR_98727_1 [Eumeta japonica]